MKKGLLAAIIIIAILFLALIVVLAVRCTGPGSSGGIKENVVYSVDSGGNDLTGDIGLEPDPDKDRILAHYSLHFKDDLPDNWVCRPEETACQATPTYDYVVDLITDDPTLSEGVLEPKQCNLDKFPNDPFGEHRSLYWPTACDNVKRETDMFYSEFTRSFDSVDEFLAANELLIYDTSGTWYVTEHFEDGSPKTWENDYEAAMQGEPVRTYQLDFIQP